MPFCSNCGMEVSGDAKYCSRCGASVNEAQVETAGTREEIYTGKLLKCPNCGEILKSFEVSCPSCGYEIRETRPASSVHELTKKLEHLDAHKQAKDYGIIEQAFRNEIINKTDKQKIELIKTFSIPNTKEDILEFLILASSNVNPYATSQVEKAISDAWQSKYDQAYQKAKYSFGNSVEFNGIFNDYKMNKRQYRKGKRKDVFLIIVCLLSGLLLLGGAWFAIIAGNKQEQEKIDQLEEIVQEIQIDISNGNYDSAYIKATSLHLDGSFSSQEDKDYWDSQREALIELINEKKEEE